MRVGFARHLNRKVMVGIAVAVSAVVAAGGVLVGQHASRGTPAVVGGPAAVASSVTATPTAVAGSPALATPGGGAGAAARTTTRTAASAAPAGPVLLWPFTGEQQALEWEQSVREGGHQPWHADACDTGQSFVQYILGFSEVTQVASCEIRDDDAWVTVGYAVEDRVVAAGATIHLVRLGHQPGGWTVVGSRDRATLTLVMPRYGAEVGTRVHLAGEVSGLGEDILTVRIVDRDGRTVGEAPRRLIGLGGPWQADIHVTNPTDDVLIAVASTDSGLGALGDLAITALVLNTPARQ